MIEVEGLSFTYNGAVEALKDVTVEFPKGTISAVLGESGSGKTTLLMCMGQFLKPQEGRITLDGQDIYEIPESKFRKRVGIVFQHLHLFPHLTVVENMILAMVNVLGMSKPEALEEARKTLDRLGIREIEDSYPANISGGQAQRAAIARGLLLKPEYMLLDEPTSALDAGTTGDFAEWLKSLKGETNFIIVTHDILFAKQVAFNGVYLSEGMIQEVGDVDKIARDVQAGAVTSDK